MESALGLFGRHLPSVFLDLHNVVKRVRAWQKARSSARVLTALSVEQLRDCGIELSEPVIEVPKGLMQTLSSMR